IQDQLLVRASGFTGDLLGGLNGPDALERAVVYRGSVTNGPQFSPFSAGSWLPPQIDKIREKLVDKRYQTAAPLELFAYSLHDEPDGAVGGIEQIDTVVHPHLPGSRFRRVHVFHYGFAGHCARNVVLAHPMTEPTLGLQLHRGQPLRKRIAAELTRRTCGSKERPRPATSASQVLPRGPM
ncbi:MAG TPA: hypothetical protein VGO18_36235, partial [Steroidobacteraceae bacterium]|nr:hypothetical protein [Steroidobacteraceae bacterium]